MSEALTDVIWQFRCAGRAVEQIWGSHGKGAFCESPTWGPAIGSSEEGACSTAQLSGARLEMIPASVLLQRCLYQPVMEQVRRDW